MLRTSRIEGVRGALLAHGTIRAAGETLKALRESAGTLSSERKLPASFLKHADDQTVVALAAVLEAGRRCGLGGRDFSRWGVLAAPRYFGRATLVSALRRFAEEGAWGVSPHLIPHQSMHAISGTISQALGIHGPNLGIGGGPQSTAEAMLAAAGLIAEGRVPGLWVVMTGWHPEPVFGETGKLQSNGHMAPRSVCIGLAMALEPEGKDLTAGRLVVHAVATHEQNGSANGVHTSRPSCSLEELAAAFDEKQGPSGEWGLPCGGWIRFEQGAGTEK
jgi:hypothetical protein